MQRFSPEYILRLKQIGLAFFEKIATDRAIAGETQDFYQGLVAGLDGAVKLIDLLQNYFYVIVEVWLFGTAKFNS